MKKIFKFSMLILLLITIISMLSNSVFAAYNYSSAITSLGKSTPSEDDKAVGSARKIVGAIISVMRIVAVGVAIIMLIVLAMKYMMAAPGDKADIKKHAVVYVVGAIVLFASSGILGIIAEFATNISAPTKTK